MLVICLYQTLCKIKLIFSLVLVERKELSYSLCSRTTHERDEASKQETVANHNSCCRGVASLEEGGTTEEDDGNEDWNEEFLSPSRSISSSF